MPSLFDIAKSGVQSYRQAFAVTGQNIANINTDGYKRREAGLTEVSSGQGGITQIQDGTGLGVRVEDIKRSFDAYLLDRKRNSFSRDGMDGKRCYCKKKKKYIKKNKSEIFIKRAFLYSCSRSLFIQYKLCTVLSIYSSFNKWICCFMFFFNIIFKTIPVK